MKLLCFYIGNKVSTKVLRQHDHFTGIDITLSTVKSPISAIDKLPLWWTLHDTKSVMWHEIVELMFKIFIKNDQAVVRCLVRLNVQERAAKKPTATLKFHLHSGGNPKCWLPLLTRHHDLLQNNTRNASRFAIPPQLEKKPSFKGAIYFIHPHQLT